MSTRDDPTARATFLALARERAAFVAHDDSLIAQQLDIARIPAPTGDENERGRWIADRLRAMGLTQRTDAAGNVIARTSPGPATGAVVICSHLDHVFPAGTPVDVRRDGDRWIGPGVVDNSRGLSTMLALARAFAAGGIATARPVEFVATTGEEGNGDLRGARHYFANTAVPPFAAIAIDGAGDERIVNVALASRRFRIEYAGPGGHSWSAYGAPNPVSAAARAAAALADHAMPRGVRSTLTVSRIGGGLSVNSIPESAWLEVDARSPSDSALERLERDIREIAGMAAATENDRRAPHSSALTMAILRTGARPGGETPTDSPLVTVAETVTRLVGREPTLATASTDANAAAALGIPAIAIGGGGRGGDIHTTHEWYENDRGADGVSRALAIVATMASMAAD